MKLKTTPILIVFIVMMISCKNKTQEQQSEGFENNEVITETQEPEVGFSETERVKIIENLQGKWKETEYPYRTAEFKNATVKFIEEGIVEEPKFQTFEIVAQCPFSVNNIKNIKPGEAILALPETQRCEKLKISNDSLILSGFSTNSNEDYTIIYKILEQ